VDLGDNRVYKVLWILGGLDGWGLACRRMCGLSWRARISRRLRGCALRSGR